MKSFSPFPFFKKSAFHLILILLGLIPLIWFKNGLLLAGGDNTSSYLGLERKFNLPSTWGVYTNFGFYNRGLHFLIYSNLANIFGFIPDNLFQMLLFSSLFFIRLLLYYKLLSFIFNNKKDKILFLPVILLFGLNPYYLLDSISLIGFLVPIQMSLVFIFIYKFLNQTKIDLKYLIFISATNSLLFSNPPALFVTYIPSCLYFIFCFLFVKKKPQKIIKRIFYVCLIFLGLNLWYLIPTVKSFLEISEISSVINTFRATSSGFLYDHFRLIGQWAWYSGHYLYPYFPFAKNYYKFPLVFTSFIPILFALYFLLFLPKTRLFKKEEKQIFYFFIFLFTLGIFLVSGAKPPLGWLFNLIYNSNSLFWMFREPFTKFTPLMVFSLPILLYGSLLYLRQKIRNNRLQKILYGMLIVVIAVNVYPIFTGEVIWNKWNASMRTFKVQVPEYWQDVKEYIVSNNLEEDRLLTFPASKYGMAYNWVHGLSSADDAAAYLLPNSIIRYSSYPIEKADLVINQLFTKLPNENFDLKRYLSLLNTKYVLQENDVDWRYNNNGALSPSKSNEILIKNGFVPIESFGLFTQERLSQISNEETDKKLHDELYKELEDIPALILYKIPDEYFLPHFYISKNITYSDGDIKMLPEIVSSENYNLRSGIFLENINGLTDSKINEVEELQNRADEIFIKGERKDIEYWKLEIDNKESLKNGVPIPYVNQEPGSLLWKLAGLEKKFDEWKVRKNPEELIDRKLFYAGKQIAEYEKFRINNIDELADSLLTNYEKEMEGAVEEVKKLENREEQVIKLRAYWERHREKINELNIDELRSRSSDEWERVFKELDGKIAGLEPKQDFSKLVYKIEIPKEGQYEVYVKDTNELEDYLLTNDKGTDRNKTLDTGNLKLNIGDTGIQYPISDNNWQLLENKYFSKREQELVLPFSGISENLVDENLRIKDYSPNSIYRISFDYKAPKGGSFFIAEGKNRETAETQLSPTRDEFRNFEMFFKSSSEAQEAAVHLSISVSEEKNLRIERIYQQEIMLRSSDQRLVVSDQQIPKITFVKINPTKYKVKVEGAKDPYTLIFSESFHQGWKTYVNDQPFGSAQDEQSVNSDQYGEVVASYFEGEIKEGIHKNIFLDRNTFETWGKKAMPEENHLSVNGYANSWYITPEDAGGRQDYELTIEFAPQRLFYIGLFISGITLVGCLIYLLYNSNILKRNRR